METKEPALRELQERVIECARCPRLVEHREQVAREKRRAFADWDYWGRPVPSFGDPAAGLLIVGLAPGAHGANRTGRMFTGDPSGDFLYGAMHRLGFCNQAASRSREDGLELRDAYITAAVRCVPPANKPTAAEKDRCRGYLLEELGLLAQARVVITLGKIAWDATLQALEGAGREVPAPKPRFGHGEEYSVRGLQVIGSYHPSPHNTHTGRLTREMFDAIVARARELLEV